MMRMWRVGTVSMGAALVLLGVLLLFTQVFQIDISTILFSWWPVLFIVLGLEILVYLVINRNDQTLVKYDIFSILFIGFLGTVGIGLAVMSTLGITDHVSAAISSQEETKDLPEYHQASVENISRVVLDTGRNSIDIEGTMLNEISVFGTYRTQLATNQTLIEKESDYLLVNQKGDTLFITFKDLPEERGWNYSYSSMSATVLIPSDMEVEVRGTNNSIRVRPRTINADMFIENVGYVEFHLPTSSDAYIEAWNVQQLQSNRLEWTIEKESKAENEWDSPKKSGNLTIGEGHFKINVMNVNHVEVYTAD